MKTPLNLCRVVAVFAFIWIFAQIFPCFAAQDDWQTEAAKRIEQHRKSDLTICITQSDGKPIPGAKVELKMVRHRFLFGCNIFKWGRCSTEAENAEYSRKYAELFNFATLGFYWWDFESEMDRPKYAYAGRVATWCNENGIRAKGHPLAWNYVDPAWAKNIDGKELYRRQMDRVKLCTDNFKGKIDTWDVINEVVQWDREDCVKQSPRLTDLMREHGSIDYAKSCFLQARAGNPNATLLINDYMHHQDYADLVAKLVDAQGKPLYDVIGIQSHMHSNVWDNKEIWETCERFAKFGKPLHFTELTVLSTLQKFNWTDWNVATSEEGEAKQRDEVVRIYTMLFSHPSVEAITWWDFSDQGAWMEAPSGLLRKDMSNKPAYDALLQLIKKDWATNETLTTDAKGEVSLRAFQGVYTVKITYPDGSTIPEGTVQLSVEKEKMRFEFKKE